MSKQDALECIMGLHKIPGKESTIMCALSQARALSQEGGSNISKILSGLLLYLITLESLSTIVLKASEHHCGDFWHSMYINNKLSLKECEAINQLRNCLAHNLSLVTTNKKHKFSLSFSSTDRTIMLPSCQWGGEYLDKTESTSTIINAHLLISSMEEIITNVIHHVRCKEFETKLNEYELLSRFTVDID